MTITNFVWDDLSDNLLMETDENGAVIADYTNEPSQFGEVLSQHRHGQDQYFHFDGLGSTRNLTDQNQSVSDSYTYTAFGETSRQFRINAQLVSIQWCVWILHQR